MYDKKGFESRKTTVFKLAKELSVLCDVDVALIMYDDHRNHNPEFWCSKRGSIDAIINRAYGKTIVPTKPAQVVNNLGVEGLNEFVGFLAAKIEQVNERINLLKYRGNDEKTSTDLVIHHEGMTDDDWINLIDFSVDGSELEFPNQGTADDRDDNTIGFCEGGVDVKLNEEKTTSDYEFEWFNQLVTYHGYQASLLNLISS